MTRQAATGKPRSEAGRSRTRREDARLVTGRTAWTDDIAVQGLMRPAISRSPERYDRVRGAQPGGFGAVGRGGTGEVFDA